MMSAFDVLFPKRCSLCESDVAAVGLCLSCESLCNEYPSVDAHYGALFYYELAIRDLILQAKYQRSIIHANVLSNLIDKALDNSLQSLRAFNAEAVTFVPTHWLKRGWRGLDLPVMLAMHLGKRLHIPLISALKRPRLGAPQSAIKSRPERIGKTHGLFMVNNYSQSHERLLLVDDITTTGATFDETKKMLHGISREIRCLAIAKTP